MEVPMEARFGRKTASLALALAIVASVSCGGGQDGGALEDTLRGQVADSLSAEASELGLDIDVETIAVSALGTDFAAMAAVNRPKPGFSEPGPIALLQLSLPSLGCGTLATGFYTLELSDKTDLVPIDRLEPGVTEVAVNIVDAAGDVVAQEQFALDVMRMTIDEAPSEESSPPVEVQIKEARSASGSIIIITGHVKSHHEFAGWKWWEWNEGTIV
jgi:hypothetical protein